MPTTNKPLEEFKIRYNKQNVITTQDELKYVFKTSSYANKATCEANLLIERLDLPLVAFHSVYDAYFTVRSNEVGYV